MVSDFLDLLRCIHGSDIGIGPLGFHAESYVDRLDRDMRSKLARCNVDIFEEIEMLEKCMECMLIQIDIFTHAGRYEGLAYLRIFQVLCTAHHVLLHVHYYKRLREAQAEILMELYVLGSTVSYAHKLFGNRSCLSTSI